MRLPFLLALAFVAGALPGTPAASAAAAAAAPIEIVVLPPTTEHVPLFPEDLARLHEAVQRWAESRAADLGGRPVPLATVREAAAQAAAGRLRADGPSCARRPTVEHAVAARWPNAGRIRTSAEWSCRRSGRRGGRAPARGGFAAAAATDPSACARVFQLVVTVSLPDPAGGPSRRSEHVAPVERPADPAAWSGAVAALRPDETERGAFLMALPRAPEGVLVDVEDAVLAGDWGALRSFLRISSFGGRGGGVADAFSFGGLAVGPAGGDPPKDPPPRPPDLAAHLAAARPALDACHVPGAVFEEAAALEVGADGAVTRCVMTPADGQPRPDHEACLCRALTALRFPAGAADRRVALGIENRADTPEALAKRPFTAWFGSVSLDDDTIRRDGLTDEEPVERCFVDHPPSEAARRAELPLALTVGADGRVADVSLTWPAALPDAARPCVEAALRSRTFLCPQSGRATVRATLGVALRE